jgi:hypothetical protein
MRTLGADKGAVLISILLLGVMLSLLGGVAMQFAWTEIETTGREVRESAARMLAESATEQAIAWLNNANLPFHPNEPVLMNAMLGSEITYDSHHPEDDRLFNDASSGVFRGLAEFGRIERIHLYAPSRPQGFCNVEVTAEAIGGVRRSAAVELAANRLPPLQAALHVGTGAQADQEGLRMAVHWGPVRAAGDVRLGSSGDFPRKSATAAVIGLGYADQVAPREDRWMEAWIGGTAEFDERNIGVPSNVHPNQDPAPGLPTDPWEYQKFKDTALKFGRYYVPDAEGRLYRDGHMDPALAQTPAQVFADRGVSQGLVFIDTLDQAPPSATNLPVLVLEAPYMEGMYYINAHVILRPDGQGKVVPALSPPTDADNTASRVQVNIADLNIQGVLHVSGRLQVERGARVFGAVMAERGLNGAGLLEVWYDYDLARGLFRGLPVVFPLSGTWKEWGS